MWLTTNPHFKWSNSYRLTKVFFHRGKHSKAGTIHNHYRAISLFNLRRGVFCSALGIRHRELVSFGFSRAPRKAYFSASRAFQYPFNSAFIRAMRQKGRRVHSAVKFSKAS
jgi:hypothetical protein